VGPSSRLASGKAFAMSPLNVSGGLVRSVAGAVLPVVVSETLVPGCIVEVEGATGVAEVARERRGSRRPKNSRQKALQR